MPLFTALMQAQGISAHVMGPDHKTVITLDLDLYERAVKLQSSTGNANWILRIGELHACFASLHAEGKFLEGSGVDCILIEAGKYSAATTRQVFTGKWFRCGVEYHLIILMGCYELLFEAFSGSEDMQAAMETSKELRIGLHGR